MPKIPALPLRADPDGTENVIVEVDGMVQRGRLGALVGVLVDGVVAGLASIIEFLAEAIDTTDARVTEVDSHLQAARLDLDEAIEDIDAIGAQFRETDAAYLAETDERNFGMTAHRSDVSLFRSLAVKTCSRPGTFVTDRRGFGTADLSKRITPAEDGQRRRQIAAQHLAETDERSFGMTVHRPDISLFRSLAVKTCSRPGTFVTDRRGFGTADLSRPTPAPVVEATPTPVAPLLAPMFAPLLVGADGVPVQIYKDGLLQRRADLSSVSVTLASDNTDAVEHGDPVKIIPAALGDSATLLVSAADDRATVCAMPVSVINAPVPATFTAPFRVLMIGDSILNRAGAFHTKAYLDAWGYDPSFIGTMVGTNDTTASSPENGVAGEAREGWSLGNCTYADLATSAVAPIAPGGEAAYLALSKSARIGYNPFVRAATGGDDPSIVRNGHVLDFAFYQARFGFDAPDVVTIGLGTNDTSDYGPDLVGANMLANMTLLLTRLKAAWPGVKIVLYCPGTGRDGGVRDERWDARYIPMLHALFDARVAAGATNITIAPTWCMATGDAGYVLAAGETDPWTGALTAAYADAVHPRGATCRQLYRALAPYIAAAAADLI